MTTKEDTKEPLLSRWSRLKQEAKQQPAEKPPAQPAADPKAPAPELPPLDKLTLDSDFRGFMHPKVDDNLRRAALKKLFSDPHFNVMDGLDVYIDDYSKSEPIPAAMLASLRQAQKILEWAKGEEREQKGARGDKPLATEQPAALEEHTPATAPAAPPSEPAAAVELPRQDEPQQRGPSA